MPCSYSLSIIHEKEGLCPFSPSYGIRLTGTELDFFVSRINVCCPVKLFLITERWIQW